MNAPLRTAAADATPLANRFLAGYGYVHGVFPELNPAHLALALVNMGFAPPDHAEGSFNYCELGYGQGVTLNALASVYPDGRFHGTDHAPEHLRFAETLARASGSRLALTDDPFEVYARRSLPKMDYIVAHGIWTWVGASDWAAIVDFVDRHLAPGGVFYVSYNTLPGWADFAPVRTLTAQLAAASLPPGCDPGAAVLRAATLVQETMAQQTGYFATRPDLAERFEREMRDNPHYLAHEYLTPAWTPTYSHEVAAALAPARVQFVCSASLRQQLEFLQLTESARAQLARAPTPGMRETLRDFHTNCRFRRDLFVRGAQRLTRIEQRERLLAMRFALRTAAEDVDLHIHGPAGGGPLAPELYRPLMAALAEHDAAGLPPPSLARLLDRAELAPFGFDAVYQALFVLVAKQDALVVGTMAEADAGPAQQLNQWILHQAERNLGLSTLVDPVARDTLSVGHVEQLFLSGWRAALTEAALIERADRLLHATGRALIGSDGTALADPVARRQHLAERLQRFLQRRLPLLRARRVVPGLAGRSLWPA
jgi:SAM-dependent methyltransferase